MARGVLFTLLIVCTRVAFSSDDSDPNDRERLIIRLPWLRHVQEDPMSVDLPDYELEDGTWMNINNCYQRTIFVWRDKKERKSKCWISPRMLTSDEKNRVISHFKSQKPWVFRECVDANSSLSLVRECVDYMKIEDLSTWTIKSVIAMVYQGPDNFKCDSHSLLDLLEPLDVDPQVLRCTAVHSFCPIQVEPFSFLDGIPNYSALTLSACDCDYAFYRCLNTQDTFSSKLLLYLYFNLFQTQDRCIGIQRGKRDRLRLTRNPKTIGLYPYPFYDTVEEMCKYAVALRKLQGISTTKDNTYKKYWPKLRYFYEIDKYKDAFGYLIAYEMHYGYLTYNKSKSKSKEDVRVKKYPKIYHEEL